MLAHPTRGTKKLSQNFNTPTALFYTILQNAELLSAQYQATDKAKSLHLVELCENKLLWNLQNLQQYLAENNVRLERCAVNQEIIFPADGEPVWANLGTIGTYFGTTPNQIGKWLEALGYKTSKEPTQEAIDAGLVVSLEMNAGGNKTRKITHWNLHLTQQILVEAGHELNFNYEDSLRGKGKNGDVAVESNSIDKRAAAFAREFASTYKNPSTRQQCKHLVEKTPKAIVLRAEQLLKKPGFISGGQYLKNLR